MLRRDAAPPDTNPITEHNVRSESCFSAFDGVSLALASFFGFGAFERGLPTSLGSVRQGLSNGGGQLTSSHFARVWKTCLCIMEFTSS